MPKRLPALGVLSLILTASAPVPGAAAADRAAALPAGWARDHNLSARAGARDPDRDGLRNLAEYRLLTNPRRADTDRDGLRDRAEVTRWRTNPRRADTDRDGHSDGTEVRSGSDPRAAVSVPREGGRPETPPAPVVSPPAVTSPGPVPSPTPAPAPPLGPGVQVDSVAGVQQAASSAPGGSTIYVKGGSYPALSLSANRPGKVTIRPRPGEQVSFLDLNFTSSAANLRVEGVTVSGVVDLAASGAHDIEIAGSDLRGVMVMYGAHDVLLENNWIHDCGNCVTLNSTASGVPGSPNPNATNRPPVSNVTVRGNRIERPSTDAFYVTNYRNLVIERNEITGVVENGDHNDCLQSTWGGDGLVFRGNYLHDNRCQGFFIKDGEVKNVVVQDNLIVRNNVPAPGQGQPNVFNVYGVRGMLVERNTIWPGSGLQMVRNTASSGIVVRNNVLSNFTPDPIDFYRDTAVLQEDENVFGGGGWVPYRGPRSVQSGSPAFTSAGVDDFRLTGPVGAPAFEAGVTWRPADRRYGLEGVTTMP